MTIEFYEYTPPASDYFSRVKKIFLVGDSPVTLDINAELGKNSKKGFVLNDGNGDITVNLSSDGSTFGDDFLLKKNEKLSLNDFDIDSVRITWISNSAYRVLAS